MEASWSTATSRFCYYLLGGKDNFAADREAAERVLAVTPGLRFRVRANRAFLARAASAHGGAARKP
jgi:hypothetical protein